ncbi:hypothetical protein MSG28_010369 [Choristoneura fumiferana]|uniref:Uncharacterized protein n=1 Tax=Choristoneura fumiferana TaxID=7141 RepID=A0ACC0KL07_CHOFU|nr:hypothetical protein MSG28_010369 [Choristoneura fumiferana]
MEPVDRQVQRKTATRPPTKWTNDLNPQVHGGCRPLPTEVTGVAGMMKKTRPTGYYGPGYFKPTTQNNSNRLTQKVVYRVSEEPETIEVIKYPPEDVPTENAMGLMKAEVAPRMRLPDPFAGPALTDLYFKGFRTLLPTGGHRYVRKFNNFNVSTPSLSVKNETEANGDIANKSSNKLHHINTTEEYSGPEAIRVDIKKIEPNRAQQIT